MTAFRKALQRNLIDYKSFNLHKERFLLFHKLINAYIKSIGAASTTKKDVLEEEQTLYQSFFTNTIKIDDDGLNDLLIN